MASLKSLHVPRRVLSHGHGSKPREDQEEEEGNKSDVEKSIRKEKSVLFKVHGCFLHRKHTKCLHDDTSNSFSRRHENVSLNFGLTRSTLIGPD